MHEGSATMLLFRYADDYYGHWLPMQILLPAVVLANFLVVLFMGVHLLRRSRGAPLCQRAASADAFGDHPIRKFEIGARLYHWGNFAFLALLAISGFALLVPGSMKPIVLSWLRTHEWTAAAFTAGLVIHLVIAPRYGRWKSMWFDGQDWLDLKTILANFLGRTKDYPRFGKYDPLQKLYHVFITLTALAVIATGTFLLFSAEVWTTFSDETMRWMRLVHDCAAASFVAIILGHVYFGLIRVNWPNLLAMFTGQISPRYLRFYHDPRRWKPEAGQPRNTD
jgi:Ni/Fe-hydrogenase 1 B-type cytochrome subunit